MKPESRPHSVMPNALTFSGLLGPNGAGKTTTVEIFEGLRVPDSGLVEVRWQTTMRRRCELSSNISKR